VTEVPNFGEEGVSDVSAISVVPLCMYVCVGMCVFLGNVEPG